jgi:hypothetical protein
MQKAINPNNEAKINKRIGINNEYNKEKFIYERILVKSPK